MLSSRRNRLPRKLRSLKRVQVVVTLTDNTGMKGWLERVGDDYIALVDASGMLVDAEGQMRVEPPTAGPHLLQRSQVKRITVVTS